jgi:hypothetical protein
MKLERLDLFVMKNERFVTNISKAYKTATVKSLRTRYVTFTSYDENNEYTGIKIELRNIDPEHGIVHFEIYKENCHSTHFWIDADDDPIIVFNNEPDVEYHIFRKIADCEINPEIKPGRLYKFQKAFTNEWFLAVVQSVGPYVITMNKLDVVRDKTFSPTQYSLRQQKDLFSILTSDKFCIEKFKNYTVRELFDLTDMFDEDLEEVWRKVNDEQC